MKTLELKHLAPYLPYGLKIHTQFGVNVPKNGHIYTVIGVCQKRTVFLDSDIVFEVEEKFNKELSNYYNEFKPLLRPLSDLTKEIKVNGEKFVPYKRLGWDLYHNECGIGERISFGDSHSGTVNVLDYIDDYFKLLEWHFDVFGLIEQGLAIDINTIDK